MLSRRARGVVTALGAVAITLWLAAEQAPAQCRGGGMQNRSGQSNMPMQNMLRQQNPMQQNVLRQQNPLQQNVLQQQNPLDQNVLQQIALQQAMLQQLALQQQQAAQLAALQRPPQQNVLQAGVVRPMQPQQNAVAGQLRAIPMPGAEQEVFVRPEHPEETAARQLRMVRDLLADADAMQHQGELGSALKIRARAGDRLQDVVAKYPGTRAADEAQVLLKTATVVQAMK
jgi:hypothetical protein